MEIFVGKLTGIEPRSIAFWAGMLTTTPQHPVVTLFLSLIGGNLQFLVNSRDGKWEIS